MTKLVKINSLVNKMFNYLQKQGWNATFNKWIVQIKSKDQKLANSILARLGRKIIASNNAEYIYRFALTLDFISHADMHNFQKAIIKIGNAQYIYYFALDFKGVDIEKLESALIKTGDPYYIYQFARYVQGANIAKLEKAIIKTKHASYIYYFAQVIPGANYDKLMNVYKSLTSKDETDYNTITDYIKNI